MAKSKKVTKGKVKGSSRSLIKRGRKGTYRKEYADQAKLVCAEGGFTDAQLARLFKVSEKTINNWKREHEPFVGAIRAGKEEFDSQTVEKSLLRRALGYEYEEVIQERNNKTGRMLITRIVQKVLHADVIACIFWLKNRNPDRWRDKQNLDKPKAMTV